MDLGPRTSSPVTHKGGGGGEFTHPKPLTTPFSTDPRHRNHLR
ncbi:hypothetical protein [Vibrio alginolyticus]|nr:hypothetical protein [Vibrio alginolyticus]